MAYNKQRALSLAAFMAAAIPAWTQSGQFRIEEASIADIQNAIKNGRTTCQGVVQAYLERAKAYNGACTALITQDGAPAPASTGMVRAGTPIVYPTQTVAASTLFPDMDQYTGPTLEFGYMEPSISGSQRSTSGRHADRAFPKPDK